MDTHYYGACRIVSVQLTDSGELHVVRQYPSNARYADFAGTPVPDKVVKEIYKAGNGRIVLDSEIIGKHKPAYRVEESIEF